MELRYYLFSSLILMFFSYQEVTGRYCNPFTEFKCFWDGECIPMKMKCDGKHDCISGEDETEWFAGCKNCSDGKFHCHKDPDYLTCIDGDYTCDGMEDCLDGEDESFEFAKCKCKRDLVAAEKSGRIECGKPCKRDQDCRPKKCKRGEECDDKKCVCDHECGMSCVTITKTCPMLKMIPHLRAIKYIQRNRKTNQINLAFEPFSYDVEAHHTCEPGYVEEPSEIRMCHGRGNETWTREIVCAKLCPTRETPKIKEKPICGMECRTDTDCDSGNTCTCDGVCGRTCVNLDVDCGEAPSVENAYIEYTGEKFDRVAHYFCKVGFYVQEGRNTRKCTGSGQYEKIPIKCAAIVCSDPGPSITATGGYIISGTSPLYLHNYTVYFGCGPGQRLLGSKKRTCGSNGRWDGILAACDNIGPLERCPHPGVPIGGVLIQDGSDENFRVGKWVEFKCNKSLVMIGQNKQECLVIKQWSGDGAPLCIAPRHSGNTPDNVIRKVYESAANVRATKLSKAGRTIQMNSKGAIEVYFVIDLSPSIGATALRNNIDFATSLVKRLSANGMTDKVEYGIIVFATRAAVKLDISNDLKKTPEEVIELLNEINLNAENIRRRSVQYGTDLNQAFLLLDERMLPFSYQYEFEQGTHRKRHVFVFTDGNFHPSTHLNRAKRDIEQAYADNPPEFYSISSSLPECDWTSRLLLDLASEDENYVFVEDSYKLHQYVDHVTDVRMDYGACGQAGEDGKIRRMISRGRVVGGDNAADRAWPWQALITYYSESILTTYDSLVGGGSLINDRWVLAVSHIFTNKNVGEGWETAFVVSLGITRRPTTPFSLQGSVKVFQPEKIYLHEDYSKLNGVYKYGTFLNDVALIKLGRQFRISKDGSKLVMPDLDDAEEDGSVDFTPYIRPVCLPCSPDNCVSEILMKQDSKGKVLLKGNETPDERCRIEYEFLIGKNRNNHVAAMTTGFGYNGTWKPNQPAPRSYASNYLQQAVLQIEDRQKCREAVGDINKRMASDGFGHIFTEGMFCATGLRKAHPGQNVVDTCIGDSGGPLVREVRDDSTKESCFVQLGIVSWGWGCGQMQFKDGKRFYYPTFFTDVAKMMPWINQTMNAEDESKD